MSGESFDLEKDEEILKLNSPKSFVKGPYRVVFKNLEDRWAIVALDWEGTPSLGIRWFWGNGGNPLSSGYPTWLIIPNELTRSILAGLPINNQMFVEVVEYLCGKTDGPSLIKQ